MHESAQFCRVSFDLERRAKRFSESQKTHRRQNSQQCVPVPEVAVRGCLRHAQCLGKYTKSHDFRAFSLNHFHGGCNQGLSEVAVVIAVWALSGGVLFGVHVIPHNILS